MNVITILEGSVSEKNWRKLEDAYGMQAATLPPGLLRTFLLQSKTEPALWRIISLWESMEAVQAMKAASETPGGVLVFRHAGSEPKLMIFDVVQGRSAPSEEHQGVR